MNRFWLNELLIGLIKSTGDHENDFIRQDLFKKTRTYIKRKSTKSFSVFGLRLVLTDPMLPLSRYSPVTDFASQLRTFFLFTDFRFSITILRYVL